MDIFIQRSEKYLALLQEYYKLECQQTLSEEDADRIEEILDEAQQDPLLDFLIDEVDHVLGHELRLINEKFIQEQQDRLKPQIDSAWMENLIRSHSPSLEEAQTCLKKEGLYNGQIDGVFGPITKQAFRALRRRVRERLEKQGLSTDSIDGILDVDQSVIEMIHQEGKTIDLQAVQLLKLEAKFSCSR